MMVRMSGVFATIFVLIASSGPLAADTAEQCSARCEYNATSERQTCAEVLPNPSCRVMVEQGRLRCLDYCYRSFPHLPAPFAPPANGSKVENPQFLHRVSDRPAP
jgi:hypothetical protein